MPSPRILIALLSCITAPALAQSSPSLNLQLPAPTAAQVSEAAVEKAAPEPAAPVPVTEPSIANVPTPYETTYGDRRDAAENGCDDETYSKPQVHGSVGMGVAASKNVSANYETTELNVSKPLGSCDDPKGGVSASIRVTRSNLNFGHRGGP
jgi:hypothetical protein